MTQEEIDRAIAELRVAIESIEKAADDREGAHGARDMALEKFVRAFAPDLADKIEEQESRIGFWYA